MTQQDLTPGRGTQAAQSHGSEPGGASSGAPYGGQPSGTAPYGGPSAGGPPYGAEPAGPPSSGADSDYARARARAMRKHKFRGDIVAYLVINAVLVVIWAATGFGYFWPGWVLGIWGAFLLLSAWDVFYRNEPTEEQIQRELRKGR